MKNDPRLSATAKLKGERLAEGVQEALHPIVNDKGLVAVQVAFLYEANGQVLGGSINLSTHPGAALFLEELVRARHQNEIEAAHRTTHIIPQMVKS